MSVRFKTGALEMYTLYCLCKPVGLVRFHTNKIKEHGNVFKILLLDVYACEIILKSVLEAENDICTRNGKTGNIGKYNFIYGNL